ncbi:MAG: FtsK/SpoIIIE domain-containing protein [Methylococcales bacterium]
MPRILSVSEVRKHLYWAAGGPDAAGTGEPTIGFLGSQFHQLFGQITGPDPSVNLVAPLHLADAALESWQQALVTHAYKTFVAPALSANQASLEGRGAEVTAYWNAVNELCEWLGAVLFEQREQDTLEQNRARIFVASEQEVCAELSDPSWSDTVIVRGRADSIVTQRGTRQRCVIELKLGKSVPVADLLQACLYHLLLTSEGRKNASRVALMVFEPARRELLFEEAQLKKAQAELKDLVWRLAGGQAVIDRSVRLSTPAPSRHEKPDDQSRVDLEALGKKLEGAFSEFGKPIELEGTPMPGPTFIRFFAKPRRGVSVTALTKLGDSIWMRLGTTQPPQIALERGRIAIDVERAERETVEFARWTPQLPARDRIGVSRFAVGVTVDGRLHCADLARPESSHVLVAGTSGSGKSEWLRSAIASLLASNTTATLKRALIDPKHSAFGSIGHSLYLWRPVMYSEGVEELLEDLIDEMERRYTRLDAAGADNLAQYNVKTDSPIPRIVCVCDEYADLLLAEKERRKLIENSIARLGGKARAAGIHLIFATQRPSRDIVKGVIDANFSGRVALRVVKPIESRLILGGPGAETLLGQGDLLYRDIGDRVRLQGLFVTRQEMEDLARSG